MEKCNLKCLSLDWKSFDTTVPRWLIEEAFDVLETAIDFEHFSYGEKILPI